MHEASHHLPEIKLHSCHRQRIQLLAIAMLLLQQGLLCSWRAQFNLRRVCFRQAHDITDLSRYEKDQV